jgi:DnaK suppressor protein
MIQSRESTGHKGMPGVKDPNVNAAKPDGCQISKGRDIAARLRELRRELLTEYEQCGAELRSAMDSGGDAAECAYAGAAHILSHLLNEIREVEAALERVRLEHYGLCVDCGTPIGANRLRAMPTARRCIRCQVGTERRAG